MTNGEMIKTIFPNEEMYEQTPTMTYYGMMRFDTEWWNAEYKEPTTKNNLGVGSDLISSITEKISEKVTETHEEFIFETIRPYCENVVQMKISKRDLEQALLKYYGKNDLEVDLISREKVMQILQEHWLNGTVAHRVIAEIGNDIQHMPSVTSQAPRKGHWIETAGEYYKAINEKGGEVNEDTDYFTDDIACSECLAKFSVIDNETERFDFCPKCGSDNK